MALKRTHSEMSPSLTAPPATKKLWTKTRRLYNVLAVFMRNDAHYGVLYCTRANGLADVIDEMLDGIIMCDDDILQLIKNKSGFMVDLDGPTSIPDAIAQQYDLVAGELDRDTIRYVYGPDGLKELEKQHGVCLEEATNEEAQRALAACTSRFTMKKALANSYADGGDTLLIRVGDDLYDFVKEHGTLFDNPCVSDEDDDSSSEE